MAMSLIVAVTLTAVLFFYWNRHDSIDIQTVFATIFMVVYAFIYLIINPQYMSSSRHIDTLLILLPLVSYGAILFPEMNPNMPVQGTKGFGWFGLVVTALILVGFKYF